MPPVLNPDKHRIDGLAFLGLSLSRMSQHGHPDTVTHQTAFDFNEVIDREYNFLSATNDDGWLVGGGEPGPPMSYKLSAKDSAHIEIMRIGTYRPDYGGVTEKEIINVMKSGKILIPEIEVIPTAVIANADKPPELEIRFDMESSPDFDNSEALLPPNWALRFIHNQLFKHFEFPSRFCPGPFHATILRKAEFRSSTHRTAYFAKCEAAIKKWRIAGPQPLNTDKVDIVGNPLSNPPEYASGIYLFQDRSHPTHYFPPNFLPPYNTPEKHKIIMDFLKEEYDESVHEWKGIGSTEQWKPKKERDGSAHDFGALCNMFDSFKIPLPTIPNLHNGMNGVH